MQFEVESTSVAHWLPGVVSPPQSCCVRAAIGGDLERRLKSSTHLQLAQFMPVLLLPVGGGAAPDFDLEGGEPRPPEVLVEPGGRFILL